MTLLAWFIACNRPPVVAVGPGPEPPEPASEGEDSGSGDTAAVGWPPPVGWGSCASLVSAQVIGSPDLSGIAGIGADPEGGRYLRGWHYGPLTLGGTTLVPVGEEADYVARYAPDGALRWVVALEGSSQASLGDFAPSEGGVAVVGTGDLLTTLGTGPVLGGHGEADAFVAQLDPEGAPTWVRSFGSAADDSAHAVAVLADGGVVVGGTLRGEVVLGDGEPAETTISVPEEAEAVSFLARFAADGGLVWARPVGGPTSASIGELAHDAARDQLVVVGSVTGPGTTVFGGGTPAEVALTVEEDEAITYVARFDPDGAFLGLAHARGDYVYPDQLELFADGAALVAGRIQRTATFGEGEPTAETVVATDVESLWVARFEADGRLGWVTAALNESGWGKQGHAVPRPDGSVVWFGSFSDRVIVGDLELDSVNASGSDAFLARLDESGVPQCVAHLLGQPGGYVDYLSPTGLALRPDGAVDVVGTLDGTVLLGEAIPAPVELTAETDNGFLLTVTLP